jgi:hypothetical protein
MQLAMVDQSRSRVEGFWIGWFYVERLGKAYVLSG